MTEAAKPPMFSTWKEGDNEGYLEALAAVGGGANDKANRKLHRAQALDTYRNIAPDNVSVREGFDRQDYEWFRPNEAIPTKPKAIVESCMAAYDRVGIVHNVVDLMSDFACDGINIVHKNPRIQAFYQAWALQVGMKERTERMLNMFYRAGNVIVQKSIAKLSKKDVENIQKAQASVELTTAAPDMDANTQPVKPKSREVPWRYTILNPMMVDVFAEELVPLLGSGNEISYGMKISPGIARKIKNPKKGAEQEAVGRLPKNIVDLIVAGERLIPLDSAKISVFHYKKDDYEVWAKPMIYSVLEDLIMLKKMKLADLTALDGAISHIRVWKLGSLEHRILPTTIGINTLAEQLLNNVGGGTMDLIWTPDIELIETSTDISKFLGEAKYKPVLTAIYAGLGVPPSLTGEGSKGGAAQNFIGLRTLTERIQYGRDMVVAFWQKEIREVQSVMGFRFPAQLTFDRMTLTDEASILALYIQLADRDLISTETLQQRFGEIPEIEAVRLRREDRARKNDLSPKKASPWHNPQQDFALKQTFIPTGTVTPSQVGLELEEKAPGEKTPIESQPKPVAPAGSPPQKKNKGQPQQGRPKNSSDKVKRKTKVVKPSGKANLAASLVWSSESQKAIAEIVNPAFIAQAGKKDVRALTDEEVADLEQFKFSVLANLPVGQTATVASITAVLASPMPVPQPVADLVHLTIDKYQRKEGKPPTTETVRKFQAAAVAMFSVDDAWCSDPDTELENEDGSDC